MGRFFIRGVCRYIDAAAMVVVATGATLSATKLKHPIKLFITSEARLEVPTRAEPLLTDDAFDTLLLPQVFQKFCGVEVSYDQLERLLRHILPQQVVGERSSASSAIVPRGTGQSDVDAMAIIEAASAYDNYEKFDLQML
eukprot:7499495-Pyramimonas_sp.AAC.1